jgi:hypothetical protein
MDTRSALALASLAESLPPAALKVAPDVAKALSAVRDAEARETEASDRVADIEASDDFERLNAEAALIGVADDRAWITLRLPELGEADRAVSLARSAVKRARVDLGATVDASRDKLADALAPMAQAARERYSAAVTEVASTFDTYAHLYGLGGVLTPGDFRPIGRDVVVSHGFERLGNVSVALRILAGAIGETPTETVIPERSGAVNPSAAWGFVAFWGVPGWVQARAVEGPVSRLGRRPTAPAAWS